MKKFSNGIVCGRFQPLHNGHCSVIDKAISECEKVSIFIGSAQESGTAKNPYRYEIRKFFIELVYGNKVTVFPMPDMSSPNAPIENWKGKWGRFFLKKVYKSLGCMPDAIYTGAENIRNSWFYPEDIKDIEIVEVSRDTIPISATEIRNKIINGEDINGYIPKELVDIFNNKKARQKLKKIMQGENNI